MELGIQRRLKNANWFALVSSMENEDDEHFLPVTGQQHILLKKMQISTYLPMICSQNMAIITVF